MNPERIDAPTMREAGLPKNLSVKPILPPVMRTRIIQMAVFFNNSGINFLSPYNKGFGIDAQF